MLQPRRRLGLSWLFLVALSVHLVQCDVGSDGIGTGRVRAERVGRDENDVNTVLLLDNNGRNGRYLATAVPVVTSTARTFVQEGTTTEYATHVIGTRLDKGKLYASVVGTSSRVYYDTHLPRFSIDNQILPSNPRSVIRPTAHLVYPAKEARVPFSSLKSGLVYQTAVNSEPLSTRTLDHDLVPVVSSPLEESSSGQREREGEDTNSRPHDTVRFSSQSSSSKHVERKHKDGDDEEENYLVSPNQESFKKRNAESVAVNAAQVVKPNVGLPTFTIKHDFAPSGFSADVEEEETTEGKRPKERVGLRSGKTLFRNGVKADNRKLDTVTYRGFADFTTTVGDTVIIFMPNTAASEPSKATDVPVVTTKSAEEQFKVVTKMKTFYSHTPGMQTKTVTGHSLSMQTSLPTHLILPEPSTRRLKAFTSLGPIHVVKPEIATEPESPVTEGIDSSEKSPLDQLIEPSVVSLEPSMPSPVLPSVVGSSTSFFSTATEPLATFATTRTQILAAPDQKQPLGLVKVLGGTRAYDMTTTLFTELIYGTVIDGTYTQVIHATSKVIPPANTTTLPGTEAPTEATTESEAQSTTENMLSTNNEDSSTNQIETTTQSQVESNNEVETGRKIKTRPQDQLIVENNVGNAKDSKPSSVIKTDSSRLTSTDGYLTRLIPTTAFKTFTYLTTFFIPDGETTTISVRSREVITSEVSFVTKVAHGNVEKPTIIPTSASSLRSAPVTAAVEKESTTTNAPLEKETLTTQEETMTPTEKATTLEKKTTLEIEKTTESMAEVEKTTTEKVVEDVIVTTENSVREEQVVTTESEEITITPTPKLQTDNEEDDEEEEIDLIFKTLYTTYTYLTTFFQESTTSVSSREVVVTNVVTSTLDNDFYLQSSDAAVAGLFNRGGESLVSTDVMPTSVGVGRPTTQHFSEVPTDPEPSNTPVLDLLDPSLADSVTKTFFTTYTYFTTIFVDGETTISSRTEVYTNIVTPTPTVQAIRATVSAADDLDQLEAPQSQIQVSGIFEQLEASHTRTPVLKSTPHYAYSKTISRNRFSSGSPRPSIQSSIVSIDENDNNLVPQQTPKIQDGYATIQRSHINGASAAAFHGTTSKSRDSEDDDVVTQDSVTSQEPNMEMKAAVLAAEQGGAQHLDSSMTEPSATESSGSDAIPEIQVRLDTFAAGDEIEPSSVYDESIVMKTMAMVTDITSSSSGGNAIVEAPLDDQISSETNTEDIEPAPTIHLETSYTTFTYFTTVYKGSTSSEVISRLETVTNVVTETISPTRSTIIEEDATLPITYFTTFTYWTTLYRDGSTVVTSREETVSNIVTPTVTLPPVLVTSTASAELEPSVVEPTTLELTTFYTTYTYFTTSYIGNSTVLNSRLETVTNVVNETEDQTGRAIGTSVPDQLIVDPISKTDAAILPTGLLSTIFTSDVQDDTTTYLYTSVYGTYIDGLYAKILESSTEILPSAPSASVQLQPTGVVSLNEGTVVDADGISTTYFTTKAIGTYIEQLYAQVIESTSSIKVDEEKKSALPAAKEGSNSNLRTGLVRLIEGSIVKDHTTTFYESKVVGTLIDGRYAQIIESTSSFKLGTPSSKVAEASIKATPAVTLGKGVTGTSVLSTSSNSAVIESSLGDEGAEDEEEDEEGEEEDDEDDGDGTSKKSKKSRLTFSTRKRTFTPVIRPFASRNRPTFNPRRKTAAASSATTITRTTLTPTITATPAAKTSEGRGRFASNRRQSSALNEIRPTASSSRRFSRVRGSTAGAAIVSSPSVNRGRSTTRVFPTATASVAGSSRRAGFYRSSAARGGSSSDIAPRSTSGASNSRFRIRPTSSGFGRGSSTSYTTPAPEEQFSPEDNDITTLVTEETPGFTDDDQEKQTQPISTTTESSRRANPLLRFRRPPTLRSQSTTARPSTTSSPRRNPLLRRTSDSGGNRAATTTTTSTTSKPAPSFNSRFKNLNNNRPRPSNSLFPRRGLLKKPEEEAREEQKVKDKEEDELQREDVDEEIADNDYEGSEVESKIEETPKKTKAASPQIRPFVGFQRRRSKRQVQSEYGYRRDPVSRSGSSYNQQQRYRRPVTPRQTQVVQERYDYVDEEPVTEAPRAKTTSRFTPRPRASQQQTQQKIRSTTASSNTGRSQFTLREKDTTARTNFRRPTTSARRRTSTATTKDTTTRSQPKPVRLRPQTNSQADRVSGRRYTNANSNTANSRRPQSRSRSRGDTVDSYTYSQPNFDGTITVTHRVPTEVTIPIVNGKVTEYRNVITASASTEILGPHQYTATSKDGNTVLLLTSEVTGTLPGGVTEITQYLLRETPTTSITFTPTTIRGRKTSYSHIVPSTVYEVERLVSTIQPQLSPNAPLANILLSQLLLGNLNLAQPNINPLLGLNTAATPPMPVTEFKTHATTYVTTVTKGTSTILPLTFRGKEILTTIVDTTLETITATEFITDTIVTTPTATVAANNQQQLNSLLLPALLQAQLLQSQQNQQNTQNPLFSLQQLQDQKVDDSDLEEVVRAAQRRRKLDDPDRLARDSVKEYDDDADAIATEEPPTPRFKASRKKPGRSQVADKKPPDPPARTPSTSVITLYVSGRRPGEFSTVLSTIVVDEENPATIKKREAGFAAPDLFKVETSKIPDMGSFYPNDLGYLENTIVFAMNDNPIESSQTETQSLESIVGDVSKYNLAEEFSLSTSSSLPALETSLMGESATNTSDTTGHFLSKGPAELAPLKRKVVNEMNGGVAIDNNQDESDSMEDEVIVELMEDKQSTRVKREVDDSGSDDASRQRRRRVRVRVPVARRIPDRASHEMLQQYEARQSDEVDDDVVSNQDREKHQSEFGLRRIKIIRGGNREPNESGEVNHKKRIVIRKRKPVHTEPITTAFDSDDERLTSYAVGDEWTPTSTRQANATPHVRRKITITKKRPIETTTASSHRRRVVVTKKRPLATSSTITPTESMITVYSYMYSVFNQSKEEPQVQVSQVFMSGNIPKEFEIQKTDTESSPKDIETSSEETVASDELKSMLDILPQIQPSLIETSFEDNQNSEGEISPTEQLTVNGTSLPSPSIPASTEATEETTEENGEKETKPTVDETSSTEDSTTFDGPRFIRPTRFSITRKPSRAKASFPGGRRKTPESSSSTLTTLTHKSSTARSGFRASSTKITHARFTTPTELKSTASSVLRQSIKSSKLFKSKTYGKSIPSSIITDSESEPDEIPTTTPEIPESLEPNVEIVPTIPMENSAVNVLVTRLVTRTRLRTYTYIVTRVAGSEEVVTSSTEVKPHVTTETVTQSLAIPLVEPTARDDRALNLAEARYNLATKVMSNGVEVIVAGDKSTLPGEPEILRVLSLSPSRPTTLAASTLTDHMLMMLPQKGSQAELASSLHGNQFVTKTYFTTYTYMHTSVVDGVTDVSKQEHVVTNTATEERRTSTPTLTRDVTLATSPVLATGVFHTTYTFFNTFVDEDLPIVAMSTVTVDNTVTAPAEELTQTSQKETNTYLKTLHFTKTVTEGGVPQVLSTKNVLTQKVVTHALPQTNALEQGNVKGSTTDVVKTYFVTYTYLNTYLEDGNTVVSSDVSISTDIVTEKFYLNPKRPSTTEWKQDATKPLYLYATKTYLTTFTYFTTLLQEGSDHKTSTLVSSHKSVVQNVVTESISPDLFGSEEISAIRNSLHAGSNIATATLQDGHKLKVTAMEELQPTTTQMLDDVRPTALVSSMEDSENSNINNIVTGSTIIFFDENDQIDTQSQIPTPALEVVAQPSTTILHAQGGPSEDIHSQPLTSHALQDIPTSHLAESLTTSGNNLLTKLPQNNHNSDPNNKKPDGGSFGPGGSEIQVSDLLSLGSLGINGLNALGPVINAMAGLIHSNLHDHTRRNDTITSPKPNFSYVDSNGNPRPVFVPGGDRTTPRSPIYIPVGGMAEDVETAESVNQELWSDSQARHPSDNSLARPSLESPLLSDGIAISPGQVITANSDVIVGRPGLLGPRPPKIHSEKEIPAGMRPPPPPRTKRPANDQYFGPPPALDQVGHQTVQDHVGGPPPPPQKEEHLNNGPARPHGATPGPRQPIRNYANGAAPSTNHHTPNRDHQHKHPPVRHQVQGHNPTRDQNIVSDLNPPPISNNLPSFRPEQEIPQRTPSIGADIIVHPPILNENHYIITNNPLSQEYGQFPVSSGVQAVFGGQPQPNDIIHGKMPTGSHVLDSSAGLPLLVNIQPSQVANVIIKDGSSTVNPFDGEEFDQSPFPVPENGPSFVGVDDHAHHYVGPVGSVHQTRMDPPPADVNVGSHSHAHVDIHPQGINVDIAPGQDINVDVSPGHSVNVPVSGHVLGKEHIAQSGIVLDEPLNGRPSLNEVSFGRPVLSNDRPTDSRRPRPPQFNGGPPRPRPPPVSHRPNNVNQFHEQSQGSNQISHGQSNEPNHVPHIPHVPHGHNTANNHINGQNYPQTPIEFMIPPPPPPTHFTNQPVLIPLNSKVPQESDSKEDLFTDDDEDDNSSIESEGGELIQASNSRPLRPGQVPSEIAHAEVPEVFMRPPHLPMSKINVHQVFDKRPVRPDNKPTLFEVTPKPHDFPRPQVIEERPVLTIFDERHELPDQGHRTPDFTSQRRPESSQKPSTNVNRPSVAQEKPTVPTIFDLEPQGNTPRPFLTRPVTLNQSERDSVLGMSPPPETQSFPHSPVTKPRRPPVNNFRNKTRPSGPYKFEVPPTSNVDQSQQSTRPYLQEVLTLSESNIPQNPKPTHNGFGHDSADRIPPHIDIEKIKPVTVRPPQAYRPKTVRPILREPLPTLQTSISRPKPSPASVSPALQTVVIVGKPIQSNPPSLPSPHRPVLHFPSDVKIVGSETVFLDQVIRPTPSYGNDGRRTDLTSRVVPLPVKPTIKTRPSVFKPTRVVDVNLKPAKTDSPYLKPAKPVELPTRYVTHTKTLTVTLTETTVVSSEGHRPSTRTVIVTKTQTSTLVDTVTQIHTLLKPTEIRATATVTTTVSATQYPPGSPFDPANYPQFPVKIAPNEKTTVSQKPQPVTEKPDKKVVEPKKPATSKVPDDADTFFVVVNDKKLSSVSVSTSNKEKPILSYDIKEEEVANRDETDSNNEVNRAVLLGGVLVAAPPPRHGPPSTSATACHPDCSPARNELCQRVNGHMRCVCRPGFARMFPDRPCKPTYTYTLRLDLDRQGSTPLKFDPTLKDTSSNKYRALSEASREGLDRLVMQSDLRDIYHGVAVNGFQPATKKGGVLVNFYVQLSDNTEEARLTEVFKKSLRTSNFSLGGTEVFADKERVQHLHAEDFDECTSAQFHDCSEHSHCFNLRGTYTCSCKEGFADLSENPLFPGRMCSAELIGCEKCHYHGTCYSRGDEQQQMCECFQWYSGENCQVNLKVLLIALVTVGVLLLALLLVCAVLTCMKRGRSRPQHAAAAGFLRYRGPPRTLDKRAMIADSSSEGSVDNGPITFLAPTHQPASSVGSKPALKSARKLSEMHASGTLVSVGCGDQRDRSLTVMIPRAKYRPVPQTSPHLSMSTFRVDDAKRNSPQEQKLIGYLEHGVQLSQENRHCTARRKQSNATNHSGDLTPVKKMSAPRKPSTGALVSAGFEVSATVGRKQEADIEIATPHNTMGSQFPIMRTNERTVSEARSCDETTVQPPTKSFHGHSQYGSKPSSRNRDEAHTMAERDLGSTLLMPQTHLYRPDRGSDISNFDSL